MKYKHVLFVDDDEDDLELIKSAMAILSPDQPYSTVNNAVKALHMLEAKELVPDLIFLDLNMPLISGQQFLEQLKNKEELKNITVYILSTSSNPGAVKTTNELGAAGFITKPMNFTALVNSLKEIIAG